MTGLEHEAVCHILDVMAKQYELSIFKIIVYTAGIVSIFSMTFIIGYIIGKNRKRGSE